ncbi:MAG: hypothetical protein KAG66_19360, partial [Methylococcales bacterium]|nr:hypothetical protein [Methylococcales bacterium]
IVDTRNAVAPGRILKGEDKQFHVYGSGTNTDRIADQGGNVDGCPSPHEQPSAVHINLISAKQTGNGNLIAYPADEETPTATLINYKQGVNISNAAVVKTCETCSPASTIAVASGNAATHVIIDVMGYYFSAKPLSASELRGKANYVEYGCSNSSCHGPDPSLNIRNVLKASDHVFFMATLARVPEMKAVETRLGDDHRTMLDINDYIASFN